VGKYVVRHSLKASRAGHWTGRRRAIVLLKRSIETANVRRTARGLPAIAPFGS
jgi:hypothetical protein